MLVATLLCGLVLLWLYFRYRRMSLLKRHNIPGPPAHFLFGNSAEFAEKGMKRCFQEWTDKYGGLVGFYMGGIPNVVITDVELLRRVQIKDFEHFTYRFPVIKGNSQPTALGQNSILWLGASDWKRLRAVIPQMFTPARLRLFVPVMKENVDFICRLFDKESNGYRDEFDIVSSYHKMTFHSMVESQLSIKVDLEKHTDIKDAAEAAATPTFSGPLTTLLAIFPEFTWFLYPLRQLKEEILEYFLKTPESLLYDLGRRTLDQRRATGVTRNDFLQQMMDWKEGAHSGPIADLKDKKEAGSGSGKDKGETGSGYSDDDIIMNIFVFLLGGYETTGTTFVYATHNLINFPDIQQRLREEAQQLLDKDGVLDYNTVTDLPLLDAFVKETLRLYPPVAPFVNRVGDIDYTYKGMTIPAGTGIHVGTQYLQLDPRYWPEPSKFDPQRFLGGQELEPIAYQPFGAGPRICIGPRFATFQLKLVLAELLVRYKFIAWTQL
ncbi:Thromboxane-A synthase [Halotydeus destructor]|nr:Thromboxane-A synthase [Halotydeus destructor]